jgi:hypothetical protein
MIPSLVMASALTLGAWGNGCGPVGPAEPETVWRRFASDPDRSYLFEGGMQVAAYDHARDIYRTYDARTDTWGPPGPPPWRRPEPVAAPAEKVEKVEAVPNYGVETDQLNGGHGEHYRLNGVPVSPERARQALAGDPIPDDTARLRLTVIGDTTAARRVTSDLASAATLAPWKDRVVVQAYAPDHWAVARAGFSTGGRPTIYVQAPSGKVLHRQDDYADGAEGLAQALRRADPNYDPAKDPDLRKPKGLDLTRIPPAAWILAAAALLLLFRRSV